MLFFLFALAAFDDTATSNTARFLPDLATSDRYDSIDPKSANGFWNKWRLVTVRYRGDNGEQRFVYANESAYKALMAGSKKFPAGAMLGKVAFTTDVDPAFPASKQPHEVSRVQLMLKDDHAEHAGWRYAIYPSSTRNGDEKAVVAACDACHALVRDRDSVFSVPAFTPVIAARDTAAFEKKFMHKKLAELPAFVREALVLGKEPPKEIAVFSMPLFSGSLEESAPLMVDLARRGAVPYALIDEESHQFYVATHGSSQPHCRNPVHTLMLVSGLWGKPLNGTRCE